MLRRKSGRITELTDKLIYVLERINLTDYIEYLENTNKLLFTNFLVGLARGVGYAVGFSLLGAVIIYVVIETGMVNVPAINEYLKNLLNALR